MSREYPDWVNPWTAAEGQRQFAGSIALCQMPRLMPLLASREGIACFVMSFSLDMDKRPCIEVQVEAELPLICQRSLVPYTERITRKSQVSVVTTLAEQELLPEDAEPVLVDESRLALLDLVEEELLLAVPLVPKSPASKLVSLDSGSIEKSTQGEGHEGPFAELAKLKSTLRKK